MARLAQTAGPHRDPAGDPLHGQDFCGREEIIRSANALEQWTEDEYPTDIVAGMKEMGLFGLTIPRSTAASASRC